MWSNNLIQMNAINKKNNGNHLPAEKTNDGIKFSNFNPTADGDELTKAKRMITVEII